MTQFAVSSEVNFAIKVSSRAAIETLKLNRLSSSQRRVTGAPQNSNK
jgi:hypothetical protein